MSYVTKKKALAGITERKRTVDGREYSAWHAYLGYDPFTKKQKRMQAATKAELVAQIERFYVEYRVGGDAAARLDPQQALDAREAIDMLAAHGVDISLAEAVRAFLDGSSAAKKKDAAGVSLGDAVGRYMSAALVGKSKTYGYAVKCYLDSFASDVGADRDMADITAADVKKSLDSRVLDKDNPKTWKTYNNHLGGIKTFFNWCAKAEQEILEKNPVADMETMKLAWHDPEYMKVEDVEKLFAAICGAGERGRCDLAHAVLSFFCGMRQAEIERVRDGADAVNVDVEHGFVRVVKCKGATSGRRPRTFTIPEPALTWMRTFDLADAAKGNNYAFREHLNEYAKAAGVRLPENAGRHTFITMHAAAYHSPDLLSSIVGNTPDIRARAYDGMETEENGKRYFEITPEKLGVKVG